VRVVRGPQRGVEGRRAGADHGERVVEYLGEGTVRPVHLVVVDRLIHPEVREIISPVQRGDRVDPLRRSSRALRRTSASAAGRTFWSLSEDGPDEALGGHSSAYRPSESRPVGIRAVLGRRPGLGPWLSESLQPVGAQPGRRLPPALSSPGCQLAYCVSVACGAPGAAAMLSLVMSMAASGSW